MEQLPIEIEIAFMDQIQSAAQHWKDGTTDYKDFRRSLRNHCRNIYNAGLTASQQDDTPDNKQQAGLYYCGSCRKGHDKVDHAFNCCR